jgi:peroxiredoxin Q/BCP
MKTNLFATILAAAGIIFSAATTFAAIPQAGDSAPLISGQDQDGKDFNLADHIGKKVVLLYFYPKDFTGGCTKEACSFRDGFEDFATNNVEIVGVSFDSADSHLQFITKYKLPFTLLADTDGKIADAYGVRMNGKNMASRVSFLIGLDGKIVHVTNSKNPDDHLAEMNAAIAGLKKP